MFDLFAAAPKDLRQAKLEEYGHYLVERDGELDMRAMTLSRREASIKRFETPPRRARDMDPKAFRKNYLAFDPRDALSPEILLLLALVKVNAAEAYGVAQNFQKVLARATRNDDETELRILVEETYHTRILLSAANHYGIEVTDPYKPPSALRVLIGGIATVPGRLARPLVLAGEVVATLMFAKLIRVAEKVLKHDPETRDAIVERLTEICTDERGHISFNRMHMGPAELMQTRILLPFTARIMSSVFQEMVLLDAYPTQVLQDLPMIIEHRHLPESVRRNSFIA